MQIMKSRERKTLCAMPRDSRLVGAVLPLARTHWPEAALPYAPLSIGPAESKPGEKCGLSDSGGPVLPHWQPMWSARARSIPAGSAAFSRDYFFGMSVAYASRDGNMGTGFACDGLRVPVELLASTFVSVSVQVIPMFPDWIRNWSPGAIFSRAPRPRSAVIFFS